MDAAQLQTNIQERAYWWAFERTVGIYFRTADGYPVPTGSGVLLKIADQAFVLSASHVLEAASDRIVIIAAHGTHTVELSSAVVGLSDDEERDYGFVRLPDVAVPKIELHKRFLRLNELDLVEGSPAAGRYSVVGFPLQHTTKDIEERRIDAKPIMYTSTLYRGDLDGFIQGMSIALAYSPHNTESLTDARLPDLGGISGGGIWRLHRARDRPLSEWDPSWIRLAGIEHHVIARKAIKGTLIRPVIECIERLCPDVRASIRVSL